MTFWFFTWHIIPADKYYGLVSVFLFYQKTAEPLEATKAIWDLASLVTNVCTKFEQFRLMKGSPYGKNECGFTLDMVKTLHDPRYISTLIDVITLHNAFD